MSLRLGLRPMMVCSALFVFGHVAAAQTKVAVINLRRRSWNRRRSRRRMRRWRRATSRGGPAESSQKEIAAISQHLQTERQADAVGGGRSERRDSEAARRAAAADDLQADATSDRNEILQRSAEKMTDDQEAGRRKGYRHRGGCLDRPYFKARWSMTDEVIAAYDKAYPAK